MTKRLPALFIALVLFICLLPVQVFAHSSPSGSCSGINTALPYTPAHPNRNHHAASPVNNSPVFETDPAAVSAAMRDGMDLRQSVVTVYYRTDHYIDGEEFLDLFQGAFAFTRVPTQGDYLRETWQTYDAYWDCIEDGGFCDYTITVYMTYETTLAQEQELAAEAERLLSQFGFTDNTSDYDKIRTIYDYLTHNIVYDYEHVADGSYLMQYTAYAALLEGTAVCEGFAKAFYYLALESNLNPRIVTGFSNGETHAWNIVYLDGLYYNLDATWDAEETVYRYFLKGSSDFQDHLRRPQFDTEAYHALHPMSYNAYPFCPHVNIMHLPPLEPTCTETGLTAGITCLDCNEPLEQQYPVPAVGHLFMEDVCTVCGIHQSDVLPDNSFVDVAQADYYYSPVLWALKNNVTTGTSPTTFGPDDPCTRGQTVMFLWRAAGSPAPTLTENPFEDVAESDYFYTAVLWAVEQGITKGTSDTSFSPDAPCTRGQIATFLYSSQGKPVTTGGSQFSDVSESDYYYTPILWAAENNVTGGIGNGMFGPNQTCTRAHIVTFLYKITFLGSPV